LSIGETIPIGVDLQWVGEDLRHLDEVAQTVVIGVRIGRAGSQLGFLCVGEAVAV
jgi:hypothetical protein